MRNERAAALTELDFSTDCSEIGAVAVRGRRRRHTLSIPHTCSPHILVREQPIKRFRRLLRLQESGHDVEGFVIAEALERRVYGP